MYGHALLSTIFSIPPVPSVAALMRHAERYTITDPIRHELAELKPTGIKAAEEFGAALKGFDAVRIFHSPVKRCEQTAEAVARGATSVGILATIAGPRDELGVSYIRNPVESGKIGGKLGEQFIRFWFEGHVAPDVVRPPSEVGALHYDFIARTLPNSTGNERRLDLHITHDWNILALREWLLGIRHEDAGWIDFLDGVAFSPSTDGQLKAFCPPPPEVKCRLVY